MVPAFMPEKKRWSYNNNTINKHMQQYIYKTIHEDIQTKTYNI